ncbi:unnamed protein product [Symbiodinium natans]|uniref:Uncharacterized protein n=1 Tax=Symbiodinium natans TaxID=878477 RepID=A0A812MW67_9DINO|nr:unnamed protein product [Symbiodinium natans]
MVDEAAHPPQEEHFDPECGHGHENDAESVSSVDSDEERMDETLCLRAKEDPYAHYEVYDPDLDDYDPCSAPLLAAAFSTEEMRRKQIAALRRRIVRGGADVITDRLGGSCMSCMLDTRDTPMQIRCCRTITKLSSRKWKMRWLTWMSVLQAGRLMQHRVHQLRVISGLTLPTMPNPPRCRIPSEASLSTASGSSTDSWASMFTCEYCA